MYQSPAYGTGSYYDTRQPLARKRTLYAPKDKLDPFEARELLKGLRPGIVLELVTRAGQEALRCSGPGCEMASLTKRGKVYYARYWLGKKQRIVCLHTKSYL